MEATPPFVLGPGDWDVDFCSDEHKKSQTTFSEGRGNRSNPERVWLGSQAVICSFIHAVCQQILSESTLARYSLGSGATVGNTTDEILFMSKENV